MPLFRTALLSAIILVYWPAAAVAQTNDQRVMQAIAAHNAGRLDQAISLLEALDRTHGDDPTTLRLLGSYYAAARRYREGIATLERARALAPHDQDIALALARAQLWWGHFNKAELVAEQISAADPTNVELPALRQSIARSRQATAARGASIAVSNTLSKVKIGPVNRVWNELNVTFTDPVSDRTAISAELDVEDRAGVTDTLLTGRIDRRVRARAGIYLAAAIAPGATFREKWSIRTGVEWQLLHKVAATVDVRHARYGIGDVTVLESGVRLQTADARASVTLRSIYFWDESHSYHNGWALRGDAFIIGKIQARMGLASYEDTEAGSTRRVRSLFGSFAFPLAPQLGLRVGADIEQRAFSYQRTGITLGLVRGFSQ